MLRFGRSLLFSSLVLAAACSSSPSLGHEIDAAPALDPGLTSATASCVANGNAGDSKIDFACTATATGKAPPPTLRVAILWGEFGRGVGDGVNGAGVLVEEKGVAPTNGTNFNPALSIPPDGALVYEPASAGPQFPQASAVGSYVLYEDLDGDQHLIRAAPGHYSPDLIVAMARDLMIYSKGGPTPGFALEEDSPFPDPADCVDAPCELPFDSGSQLLGPGTKIELVAVGPITGELAGCAPPVTDNMNANGDWSPPACANDTIPAGNGVICMQGEGAWTASCPAITSGCSARFCTWCQASLAGAAPTCALPASPYQ